MDPMSVEARFLIHSVVHQGDQATVTMYAAYNDGKGNEDWSKWTPAGTITMVVTNPAAAAQFEANIGKVVGVNFRSLEG